VLVPLDAVNLTFVPAWVSAQSALPRKDRPTLGWTSCAYSQRVSEVATGYSWRSLWSQGKVAEAWRVPHTRWRTEKETMLDQEYSLSANATEVLGDLAALAEQLGRVDEWCWLPLTATSWGPRSIENVASLREFLNGYACRILIPHELPAVAQAYGHVARYEARELIALDQALDQLPILRDFANASRRVGNSQLQRLRPLRGERVVHRYLEAVERGEAQGWHTLVYGLVLALYSIPLRQGLVHFAHQTLGGFAQAAAGRVPVSHAERQQLLEPLSRPILATIETIVAPGHGAL
jgi:urease accessory protein UreF